MRTSLARTLLAVSLLAAGCSKTKPACQGDAVVCGDACADLGSDNLNCGACGTACQPGTVCSTGTCQLTCAAGLVDCGGACLDPKTDRAHCGASGACTAAGAGTACGPGQVCSNGACALSCQPGLVDCNGTCVDPLADPRHCGVDAACGGGQTCGAGFACSAGTCQLSCQAGLVDCGGRCVDPATDRSFCGAGAGCAGPTQGAVCASGQVCAGGACQASCLAGQVLCGGKCVNPATDLAWCGASGDCAAANAGTACGPGQVCSGGTCAVSCGAPLAACSNACVDPRFDPANCGGCGVACSPAPNAAPFCLAGACSHACLPGFLDCDGSAATGCEVDPAADSNNCGRCGLQCGAVPNGSTSCSAGACAVSSCGAGFADCDGAAANGCEINTQTDGANCGACGTVCGGVTFCFQGACALIGGSGTPADPYRSATPRQHCRAYHQEFPTAGDGIYLIDPTLSGSPIATWCDQTSDGGGWTRCLSFVNTLAEDVTTNTWFDTCVDWSNAAWQSGALQVTLRDASGAVAYRTTGTKTVAWTYDQITSTNIPSNQYYSFNHDRLVVLANGDRLMIAGRNSSNAGCGGSLGNGYGIVVYPTSPNYYSNEKLLVMPYKNLVSSGAPRNFAGWSTASEITWQAGTMNSCTGLPPGFLGSFEFYVR